MVPRFRKIRWVYVKWDKNFRATDAIFGEDGALYVSDWQNVIIGHMQHNVRDPNAMINMAASSVLLIKRNLTEGCCD